MIKDHENGIIYRIDALRKKKQKNIYIMKMINKKLMSEIISTTVEKEKRINLNMDS